jgi:hypothetical protein
LPRGTDTNIELRPEQLCAKSSGVSELRRAGCDDLHARHQKVGAEEKGFSDV